MGYVLNKQEFRDSRELGYGGKISDIPSYCVCGEQNDICGHIIFRQNRIRDINANFLRQVCHDVVIKPKLLPVECTKFQEN